MKITKKYYVASPMMNPSTGVHYNKWAKETLEEAIEHATQLAQDREEDQLIVQIIKIVKVQRIPVTVEEVE